MPDRKGNRRGCGTCWSLERHRLFAAVLPALARAVVQPPDAPLSGGPRLALDVAPCRALDPVLERLPGLSRVRMDFDPAADGRLVDIRASITALPFGDQSVDLLVCSHVLEHVPDDAAAIREISRVLAPGGVALIAVPWRPGPTDEDPDASEAERLRRFGQADHVRYYGDDFESRLLAGGIDSIRMRTDELLDPSLLELLRLIPDEPLWIARRSDSPHPLPDVASLRPVVWEELGAAMSIGGARSDAEHWRGEARRLQTEVQHWRSEAQRWQRQFRGLRGQPAVRALYAANRVRKRLIRG